MNIKKFKKRAARLYRKIEYLCLDAGAARRRAKWADDIDSLDKIVKYLDDACDCLSKAIHLPEPLALYIPAKYAENEERND